MMVSMAATHLAEGASPHCPSSRELVVWVVTLVVVTVFCRGDPNVG